MPVHLANTHYSPLTSWAPATLVPSSSSHLYTLAPGPLHLQCALPFPQLPGLKTASSVTLSLVYCAGSTPPPGFLSTFALLYFPLRHTYHQLPPRVFYSSRSVSLCRNGRSLRAEVRLCPWGVSGPRAVPGTSRGQALPGRTQEGKESHHIRSPAGWAESLPYLRCFMLFLQQPVKSFCPSIYDVILPVTLPILCRTTQESGNESSVQGHGVSGRVGTRT